MEQAEDRIVFYLSTTEKKRLHERARSEGLSVSAWLRRLVTLELSGAPETAGAKSD